MEDLTVDDLRSMIYEERGISLPESWTREEIINWWTEHPKEAEPQINPVGQPLASLSPKSAKVKGKTKEKTEEVKEKTKETEHNKKEAVKKTEKTNKNVN